MKDKLIRAVLLGAGCHDPDAAIKLGDFSGIKLTETGDVDAASVTAAVGTFRAGRPYMFGSGTSSAAKEPAVEPVTPKSALDMTDAEYKAARWAMKGEAEQRRRESLAPNFTGKSASEMTDAEYEAARRRGGTSPTCSMTTASDQIASLMATRGSRPRETAPSAGAILLRQRPKPGERRAEPATWGGLNMRDRSTTAYQSLAPGHS